MEVLTFISNFLLIYAVFRFLRWLYALKTIDSFSDRYILITGCDSGFGHEACIRFSGKGFKVFAGCLTDDAIEYFKTHASGFVIPFHLDVTSEESIKRAGSFVRSSLPEGKGLWALINNAGITGTCVPVLMETRKDYETCLNVNLLGMIDVTREFFLLLQKEKGRVVNTASMLGRIALPALSPYCISKYGAEAFSDCLRREIRRFGVSVHIIEPGFFKTALLNLNGPMVTELQRCFDKAPTEIQKLYGADFPKRALAKRLQFMGRVPSPRTHLVTDAYIHAVTSLAPKYRYIVGLDALTVFRLLWNVPEFIADAYFWLME